MVIWRLFPERKCGSRGGTMSDLMVILLPLMSSLLKVPSAAFSADLRWEREVRWW